MKRIAVLLFLVTSALAQSRFTPVPASQIHGRTFTPAGGLFSVDLPAADWEVLEMTELNAKNRASHPAWTSTAWVVRDPSHKIVFSIYDAPPSAPLTADYMEHTKVGTKKSVEETGGTFSGWSYEETSIPVPGSYRFTYVKTKKGVAQYRFGYMPRGPRHVMLQMTNDEKPEELRAFKRLVVSFRWSST